MSMEEPLRPRGLGFAGIFFGGVRNSLHAGNSLAESIPSCSGSTTSSTCRQPTIGCARFPKGNRRPSSHGKAGARRPGNGLRRLGGGLGAGWAYFGGCRAATAFPAVRLWPLGRRKSRPRKDDEKKRIMVLMSDTGGGHRASAEALQAGFEQLYGDKYKVDYVDVWSDWTPYPFSNLPKSYSFLVKNAMIWRMGYYVQQPRLVHYTTSAIASLFVSRRISEAFDHYQPDLVVSVHPLMQHVPLRVLRLRVMRGQQKAVAFATVVTDLTTCHNLWFHPDVDRCFVPTQITRRRALKMGVPPDKITVHGLPIRPAFSTRQPPQAKLRRLLGMAPSTPAILLVGGGEGMGAIEATVAAIAATVGPACQLVVICGRNKKLAQRLQARTYPEGMHMVVEGFVSNMAEWMSACNCIVTKAGPGTIAESLICGLPVLLNGFIPCQEAGNVPFVLENQVGAFEREPAKIAAILEQWVGSERAEFDEMARRAAKIGKKWRNALFRIVEDLAAMVAA